MKRKHGILLLATALSVAVVFTAREVTRIAKQRAFEQRVHDLRNASAALVEAEQFSGAAETLEELQVLFMEAGRYEDALQASLAIEDVSKNASARRSPWNFVRIAEAYLGMGERDRYFDWMESAVRERRFSKLDYFQDARLDPLRDLPRFESLVAAAASLIGVGQPARDFRVTLLDGSTFRLAAQQGKVVLIDFWDVRCIPCRQEMPNLRAIHRDFRDRGLEMIGISLDTEPQLLDEYLREEKLPWKMACSFAGWDDPTALLYQISATPSTWLIDRRGVVRYYDLRGAELRSAVETLTNES